LRPQRILTVLVAATLWGLLLSNGFVTAGPAEVALRAVVLAFTGYAVFACLEQVWMPRWFPRWVLQVVGVGVTMPVAAAILYGWIARDTGQHFWEHEYHANGFAVFAGTGVFFAPWFAMGTLIRQRDGVLRNQAQEFALERSELERRAVDARLRLLQSQVAPHFLFNTLANVRELVVSGSAQASTVLDSLIAYLRAAVPRLDAAETTLGDEVQLVRAYLELMQMRMPDRLQVALQIDDAMLPVRCPPTTLLTLVENAVRHGIDPSEEGGRIDVHVQHRPPFCRLQVRDTGVGLGRSREGLGTGLAALRERLGLMYPGSHLTLSPVQPHGAIATVEFPVPA
jgi:signal transduction histidine kinase